jgi:uncharacterized protein
VKDVAGEAALAAGKRLAEGAPVSFLARYRKDATLGLDEAALRRVQTAREVFERLEARRATILEAAERQKKRGPELEERLAAASDLVTLEDLFLPFRRKKGPTAAAREAGLEPLAEWIWRTGHGTETPQEGQTLELWSFTFRNPEKGVKEAADAVAGARGLLAERLAEDPDLRALARREVFAHGVLEAHRTDKAKAGSKHEALFSLREKASALRNGDGFHRVFALRRSANEGELQLKVVPPPDDPSVRERLLQAFETAACSVPDSPGAAVLKQAAREALEEHVWPDLEAELIQSIREEADRAAIRLLAEGARRRLMAPPLGARPVLGLHPTKDGGVLALVDASGRLVKAARFLLGEEKASEARELVASLVREGGAAAVAVGEATAGRERVAFVEDALRAAGLQAVVQGVSEAAAAAWRASEDARAELKEADTETRSAVALARRLQDPLLELAKLEPRSLAEGPYVHEVSARLLAKRLEQTLDSCLHEVGLDLNRASWKPLSRVAGLDEERARAIVAHREKRGPFASRAALLQEGLLDEKAFEQAAGFLLVPASAHPLDATRVHPERYPALEAWAIRHGKALADLRGEGAAPLLEDAGLRDALGPRTLEDVVAELRAPGRDPRGPFVPFRYRAGVSRLEDLRPGMICPGLVTNATSFGVFVDVGVPHDGLVHLSQLPAPEGGAPRPALLPGDRVEVRVVKVDLEKKQISLSMRGLGERAAPPRAGEQRAGRGERRPRPPRARPGTSEAPAHASKPAPDARQAPPPRVARPRPSPPPPRPDGAERSGPRPERPRPRADRPSSPDRPGAPSRPAFNNPFAVLAKLKEPKKD